MSKKKRGVGRFFLCQGFLVALQKVIDATVCAMDGALEPPRTGSRRVAEMTSVKPEQEPNPTAFQYRPPPYAAWPAARCIRQNGKCWRPIPHLHGRFLRHQPDDQDYRHRRRR